MKQRLIAYLAAIVSAYVLAVILVSQFNIAEVQNMGFAVSFTQRVEAVLHDLVGMTASYLPLLAVGFLLAFLFTGIVLTRLFAAPAVLYPLAGFVAVIAIHSLLYLVFGISGVAPTRSTFGLLAQGMAGALGGWVYWRLRFAAA